MSPTDEQLLALALDSGSTRTMLPAQRDAAIRVGRERYERFIAAAPQQEAPAGEVIGWATHHDAPMLFPTRAEAASYCEADEEPIPLVGGRRQEAPAALRDRIVGAMESGRDQLESVLGADLTKDLAATVDSLHASAVKGAQEAPGVREALDHLADKVVITNATGREPLFLAAVRDLLAAVRALAAAPTGAVVAEFDNSFVCYSCRHEWETRTAEADCPECGTTNLYSCKDAATPSPAPAAAPTDPHPTQFFGVPFKVGTWPVDADGFVPTLCTECGTPVRYGSRHSKCGMEAMAREKSESAPQPSAPVEAVAAYERAATLVEVEHALDQREGRRLQEIAQHIRDLAKSHRAPPPMDGIELAAQWVQKRLDDFVSEHGILDHDTGAVEFGRGPRGVAQQEYAEELAAIIEGVRALATPSAAAGREPT